MCSLGCPGTSSVEQASLALGDEAACLSRASAGVKGVHYHHLANLLYFFLKPYFYLFKYVCMPVYIHVGRCPWRLEEDSTSSGLGVTGGYEPFNMSAENRTLVCARRANRPSRLCCWF